MTVLAVKGLTYSFGKQTVLDNISFTLEKGDIAGLIGNEWCREDDPDETSIRYFDRFQGYY